jgi:FkbM family methyltransferase
MKLKRVLKKQLARIHPHKTIQYRSMSLQGAFEDYGVLQAIARGVHEPYFATLFEKSIQPGTTVVDIGAHLGKYVLLAGQQVGPQGHVFGFEPHPRTFGYLKRNVTTNFTDDRVKIFNCAITEQSGTSSLFMDMVQSDFTSMSFVRDRREVQQVEIETRRLADIPELDSADCIKIDVEGAELIALDGCESIINQAKNSGKPLKLFIESNPDALHAFSQTPQTLYAKIQSLGFRQISIINEETHTLDPLVAGWEKSCSNLYCEL